MDSDSSARDLYSEAARAHQASAHDVVENLCRRLLAIHPGDVGALLMLSEAREMLGDIRGAVEFAQRALELAPDNATAWNKRGALFGKEGLGEDALRAFERAHALDGKNAVVVRNLAQAHFLLGQYDDALLASSRSDDQTDAVLSVLRGKSLMQLGRAADAVQHFEAASVLRPRDAKLRSQIGSIYFNLGLFERACGSFGAAVELQPRNGTYLSNYGLALTECGRYRQALDVLNRAVALHSGHALALWHRSLVLLVMGDLENGFHDYEARFLIKEGSFEKLRRYDAAPWMRGDQIAGKTVFLYCGQGLGDTIQFVRYAPLIAARGARVVVEVQRSLRSLLDGLWPGVSVLSQGDAPPKFDMYCPMASVPLRWGTTIGNIPAEVPYVEPDRTKSEAWRRRLSGLPSRLHVGVAWAGNPKHARDAQRSIAFEQFSQLFGDNDLSFVNLQRDLKPGEAALLARQSNVLDASGELVDFSDTAALVANLDLVISIDSSVAHLTGALGRPFWLLTPFAPDWRWLLEREDSPWYPTARLFRQPGPGTWTPVIRSVVEALTGLSRDAVAPGVAGLERFAGRWSAGGKA